MNALSELQDWYLAQCDGYYEDENGIRIRTLDNPGWHLTIDLHFSLLRDQVFDVVQYGDSSICISSVINKLPDAPDFGNWIHCYVENNEFHGLSGALKLEEIIRVFLKWAHETEAIESTPEAEKRRELRDKEKSDRAFWDVLGDEVWKRNCSIEGCPSNATRFSAWCRRHHFKKAKGYDYPFEDEPQSDN